MSEGDAVKMAFLADGNYSAARKLISENEQAALYLRLFQEWMRACLKFDARKVADVIEDLAPLKREKHKNFFVIPWGSSGNVCL